MANVAVIGSQWGDEGKGKIVDWLSSRADVVVRFQGGHNAGHTLVIDGVTYKLSLLPSGIVRQGKLSVIGNGVVIDPWHLIKEIKAIREKGVDVGPHNLVIAENATLILPVHQALDAAMEQALGARAIGTTKRGIGLKEALPIFAEIRDSVGLPVITDVHEVAQCAEAAMAEGAAAMMTNVMPTERTTS